MAKQPSYASSAIRWSVRSIAALIIMLLFVQAALSRVQSYEAMLDIVCQVELFRLLFYAMLPVCLLVLLAPSTRRQTPLLGAACLALAPLLGAALACAPLFVYRYVGIQPWSAASGICIALNLAGAGWIWVGRPQRRLERLLRCSPPLADLLFPLPTWILISRDTTVPRWLTAIMRAYLLALLAGCCLFPWLWDPLPANSIGRYDHSANLLLPGFFYQTTVDPLDGDLLVVDSNNNAILKIAEHDGSLLGKLKLDDALGEVQAVAIAGSQRKIIYADGFRQRMLIGNLDQMRGLATIPFTEGPDRSGGLCRTYWQKQRGLLCSVCVDGLRVFCDSGRAVRAYISGPPGDLAFDPSRDELLYSTINGELVALNLESLEVTRSLVLGSWSEKLALDSKRDRLFISQPYLARVLVLDLERFEPIAEIQAMPGARALLIDPARDRLLVFGLSPLMEVRDLENLALIARLNVPPWVRWLTLDARNDRIYFTTGFHGLYKLDPASIEVDTLGATFKRADPFYALFRLAAVFSASRYGRRLMMSNLPISSAQYIFDGQCEGPPWYLEE
ncbi:MAG: hypothetical protein P9M14_11680 [Candidatus Alcyoniella australis]|nr:hypothetical protein [Candidatus Alcyoniella australis]